MAVLPGCVVGLCRLKVYADICVPDWEFRGVTGASADVLTAVQWEYPWLGHGPRLLPWRHDALGKNLQNYPYPSWPRPSCWCGRVWQAVTYKAGLIYRRLQDFPDHSNQVCVTIQEPQIKPFTCLRLFYWSSFFALKTYCICYKQLPFEKLHWATRSMIRSHKQILTISIFISFKTLYLELFWLWYTLKVHI